MSESNDVEMGEEGMNDVQSLADDERENAGPSNANDTEMADATSNGVPSPIGDDGLSSDNELDMKDESATVAHYHGRRTWDGAHPREQRSHAMS